MNRRRLLAAALPFFFGSAALRASAQNTPAPKPKRIRIEVSLQKTGLTLGETNAQIIVLTTEEGVATDAVFLQMYSFRENKADGTVSSQAFGPKLNVAAQVQADGRIRLSGKIEFEEATAAAAPNQPLPVSTTSLPLDLTVANGQAVTLGGVVVGKETRQVQLTATLL